MPKGAAGRDSRSAVIAEGLFSYQIGGSERIGVDLALEFARRGHKVLCFAFYDSDGPMRAELTRSGIRCLDLNYEKFRGAARRVTYQYALWRMLRRERITALHVHHATALILCGIPSLFSPVKRVVMTEHGLHQLKERPNYRRSATRYCRFADEITVVEPAQADYFHDEMSVPRTKLHYVANGVRMAVRTAEKAHAMRQQLEIPENAFAFFYVGRLNPVKDLGTLLRAMALLPKDLAGRTRLFIVGDGSERRPLEETSVDLGLGDRLKFLGARTDVSDLLMAADAFAMSSKTEGLPMALLEAMAAGVPCVSTAVGGIPQLLAHGCGLLAPVGDSPSLSAAMEQLIRSPEVRSHLSRNALANVRQNYSLEAVADRYLALLGIPAAPPGVEALDVE